MEQALMGLIGVKVCSFLTEHFRRQNRIEAYSSKVFDERQSKAGLAGFRVIQYADGHSLYLSEEIIVHCCRPCRNLPQGCGWLTIKAGF